MMTAIRYRMVNGTIKTCCRTRVAGQPQRENRAMHLLQGQRHDLSSFPWLIFYTDNREIAINYH
jgi:hypothetical protein